MANDLVAENQLGLVLPDTLTFEGWVDIGAQLATQDRSLSWMIGDWWAFGCKRGYGERAGAAIEAGVSPDRLTRYAQVARLFELCLRKQNVPFSIYELLATINDDEQRNTLLNKAVAEEWTWRQTREAIKLLKGPAEGSDRVESDPGVDPIDPAKIAGMLIYMSLPKILEVFKRTLIGIGVEKRREFHKEYLDEILDILVPEDDFTGTVAKNA